MTYGVIYTITNQINGKQYVGQTIRSIEVRFKEHCYKKPADGRKSIIYDSIKKYGKENFTIAEIDKAKSLEELNKKEIYWIDYYNSKAPNGYNLTDGGLGHRGITYTPEQLERKSQNMTGENNPNWGNSGEKNHFYGKKHSEETRKHLSEIASNREMTEERLMYLEKARNSKGSFNKKAVINLDTDEVFESASEARRKYNTNYSGITDTCKGRQKTCKGFRWMYYKDYLEQQNNKDTKAS